MDKRVMVVDDEPAILDIFREALEGEGYEVVTALGGEEALGALAETPVQVFFLDLNMPGMTGLELGRRIRAAHPEAKIYAVTGFNSLYDLARCREAGFDDYFLKPVDLQTLLEAARAAFAALARA